MFTSLGLVMTGKGSFEKNRLLVEERLHAGLPIPNGCEFSFNLGPCCAHKSCSYHMTFANSSTQNAEMAASDQLLCNVAPVFKFLGDDVSLVCVLGTKLPMGDNNRKVSPFCQENHHLAVPEANCHAPRGDSLGQWAIMSIESCGRAVWFIHLFMSQVIGLSPLG